MMHDTSSCFRPYDPGRDIKRIEREHSQRIQAILENVAGAALASATAAAQSSAAPASQEPGKPTAAAKGKLKRKLVYAWLRSLPMKVMSETDAQLSREGDVDEAERQASIEAAVLEVRQATPARLRTMLESRGLLNGYTYTERSANKMIRLIIASGDLQGWTGGKALKAAATGGTDDDHDEHDVDAEFNPRRQRRSDEDSDRTSSGMSIRNRLHRQARPEHKAARRGGLPSRDELAIDKAEGISEAERKAAKAFFEAHPELEEG